MGTLVVYFSKTGNSKRLAEEAIKELGCDYTELIYDEKANKTEGFKDPTGYDRVMLFCPIWAFMLPEPMKHYLKEHGKAVQSYSLVVTYSLFGLRGCISNCKKFTGKPPEKAMKIKGKLVKAGEYDIKSML